jgi:hypothetical protein
MAYSLASRASNRPWLIACDQTGVVRPSHYGFGTLWMPYDRRGDFSGAFGQMAEAAGFVGGEIRWEEIGPGPRYRFARSLVDYFFQTSWLAFHCLAVEQGIVDMDRHADDLDLARRKHFTMLLANKVRRAISKRGSQQEFRVWVAPIPSPYAKAAEAVEVISSNIVAEFSRRKPNLTVTVHERHAPTIQMCGLLLGAVMESWGAGATAREKAWLSARMAGHLGWEDLRHDTMPQDRKFNVWKFHDPVREPSRSASTRPTRPG